jgi:DNA-3-methyladenine glycosylase II
MLPLADPWRPWRGAAAYMLWTYYRVAKQRDGAPISARASKASGKKAPRASRATR